MPGRNAGRTMASALDTAIACSDPERAEALHRLGLAHFAKRRMAAAAEALGGAVAADPANPLYAFNLGVVLAAAGRNPEALAAYDQSIAHNPAAWRAHFNAGVMRRATVTNIVPCKPAGLIYRQVSQFILA